MKEKGLYHKIFLEIIPFRKWFIVALILSIAVSILGPIRPFLLQYIIDHFITTFNKEKLISYSLLLFGLLIIESFLRYFFVFITAWFSQNIVHSIRTRVFQKLIGIHVQLFDQTPIGTLTTRTINDVETINEVYSENFFTIISDFLTIIIVLSFMFYTDVKLTLISLVTLPLLYWATYIFKEKVKIVNQKIRDKISEFNAFTQEHLTGIKLIKSFTAEQLELQKFKKINQEQTDLNIKAIWYYSWFFPVLETLIAISVGLVVMGVGYFSLNESGYTAGMISSFYLYLNMLFRPMRFLADKFNQLQMGFVACERVFKIIETPNKENDLGQIELSNPKGNIRFDQVTFGYLPEKEILKNISFEIKAGESLAIVGATGSGKTSIINVLNRFYPIQKGDITIDDISIYDTQIASLRNHIGMVLQDVYLFSGSILDNIRLENKSFDFEKAMQIAKELDIQDFFEQLPGGFDFEIQERGNSLSHGQKQVISFLRAIVKNPSILILDEATSSIDSNTEYYIQKLVQNTIKNKTSIVIAHRLSTIISSDKILVLDKGEIVGEGTHSELIQSNTYYKKYFKELESNTD